MPIIQKVVSYRYNGIDYPTVEKAVEAWENELEKFIREKLLHNILWTREATILMENVLENREALRDLLLLSKPVEDNY